MAFGNLTDLPRKIVAEARRRGYSTINDNTMLMDGWYIIALRTHISDEVKDRGDDWNWYKELRLTGSDNMGPVKQKYSFQWPNAPWTEPPIKCPPSQSVVFFKLVFETPEDMVQFRLKYL